MFQQPPAQANNPVAQANQLFQRGDFAGAIRLYRQVLKKQPAQPDLLHRVAIAQAQIGEYGAAIRDLEKALRFRPRSAQFLTDLAQVYMGAQRYPEAENAFERAHKADPNFAFVHGAKAELFQLTGEFDKAAQAIDEGLAQNPDDPRLALAYAKLAPRLRDRGAGEGERRAIALLEPHLERLPNNPASNDARMNILFRLADQHDRLGEYDRAFARYTEANNLSPRRFDAPAHRAAIDRVIAGWTPESIDAAPRAKRETDIPVFIVGMPRSGTSLVEQILACHPEVHGLGEPPDIPQICAALGGGQGGALSPGGQEPMIATPTGINPGALEKQSHAHLARLRKIAPKASRITDKLPSNFMHLGMISRLLPGARIIHCTRDPLDTCLSCYFQYFLAPFPWSFNMEWLGAYYVQYERIMAHWASVLPDLPILEVPYESMVEDQEAWTRTLIEFVGLEWDDACLRFHESKRVTTSLSNEQVRRPMYRSSMQRWKNYDAHLGPLRAALGMD